MRLLVVTERLRGQCAGEVNIRVVDFRILYNQTLYIEGNGSQSEGWGGGF